MEEKMPQYTKNKTSITFEVEDVSLATELLPIVKTEELIARLGNQVTTSSNLPKSLVDFGRHTFIAGLYQAYSDHRPFTISPEMIWILIQQGISMHLYHNVSALTRYYPELIERKELIVNKEAENIDNEDWKEIIEQFRTQVQDYLDPDFVETFRVDFSNSTEDEIVVGDLMLMDAMQPYFKYIVNISICGIPKITVEGSASDWDKILSKLDYFKSLELDWWFKDLEPIIKEIRDTANGKRNLAFWRNIFKVHTKETYGKPKVIDGWITCFYPYDKKGKRILNEELTELTVEKIFDTLPSDLKTIPFKIQITGLNRTILKEYSMEFTAGFIGLRQSDDFTLRPELGWFIGAETDKTPKPSPYAGLDNDSREYYSLEKFPEELLDGKEYGLLILHFKNDINYPEEIADIKATSLMLTGGVREGLIEDLRAKFGSRKANIGLNYDWDNIL
ncbi:MAG: DUF4419 domain-containing protein [Bacteroidota bacterium]